jgi:hypothetical protein
MISMRVTTKSNIRFVKKRAKAGTFASLSHASATIRKTARQSIRKSKRKPSDPGKPPKTRQGQLKKSILYAVDKRKEVAVIGPARHLISDVAAAHEHGRKQTPRSIAKKSHQERLDDCRQR